MKTYYILLPSMEMCRNALSDNSIKTYCFPCHFDLYVIIVDTGKRVVNPLIFSKRINSKLYLITYYLPF